MQNSNNGKIRFCQFCGETVYENAVVCTSCGRQISNLKREQDNNISNTYELSFKDRPYIREKNKWIALLLLLFAGIVGAHKFYENRIVAGIVYVFMSVISFGILTLIFCFFDFFAILFKPNPYYL